MSLINKKIKHKIFGEGVIINQDDTNIIIDFNEEKKKFSLDVAIKYLTADKETLMELQKFADKKLKQNEKEKKMEKQKQIEYEKQKIKTLQINNRKKVYGLTNIAFKCNYNDSGFDENNIGFCGVCSDKQIEINQNNNKAWCSNENCMCKKYTDNQISRKDLDKEFENNGFICYEAKALKKFSFSAGCDFDKHTKQMKARHIQLPIRKGSVVFLTTVDNYESGKNRYVFAAYIVDNNKSVGIYGEDAYGCDDKMLRVYLSKNKAKKVKFWDFYKNKNNPDFIQWGTGLYREISNEQAINILNKMKEVDKNIQTTIDNMIKLIINKE